MHKRDLEHRLEKLFSPSVKPDALDRRETAPSAVSGSSGNGASASGNSPDPALRDAPPGSNASDPSTESAFFKAIVDQVPDPVFIKDRDHEWVFVNSAFCELIGQPEGSLLGRTDHDYFPGDQADAAWKLDDQVFETGQSCVIEESIASADSRIRIWRIRRQPLSDASGRTGYVVGIIRDVTDLKRAEIALKESETKYRTSSEWWEEQLRKLKRGLLFQFTFFGLVAGLTVSLFVMPRVPELSGKVYADESNQLATVGQTPLPPLVEIAAASAPPAVTITPEATPTPQNTAPPSPTPTLPHPIVTVLPTLVPQAVAIGTDTFVAPPAPAPLRDFGSNVINIVLMGSDRRPGDGAWRTDVLIVASIDPDVPSLTLLSFPRDLWVYIPGWRWQRLNLADGHGESSGFPGGGPGLVKQTIQYNFGIPVHYYARVAFTGYKRLIDSVGGVDVVADCTLYDIFPDVPDGQTDIISGEALSTVLTGTIDIPVAGVYHLDGQHALWYARSRKTTSDFDRSRRQQRVLRALWNAIRDRGLISQLPQVWDSLTQTVETDLGFNDLIYLADIGARISPAHIRSRFIDGSLLTWHVTETGANVLLYDYEELAPYLDEALAPLPENIASQAPAWVDVLNGTAHPDWERVAADRLGWAGFSVSGWGRADLTTPHTTIIDYTSTSKGTRLLALAELFHVAPENILDQPDPNSPFSYRVIVGDDFEPCQRPSRGQWPAPPPTPVPTPEATPTP